MFHSTSQPVIARESLTVRMRTWCVYAASVKANGRFASLGPRQRELDRGRGLWSRKL